MNEPKNTLNIWKKFPEKKNKKALVLLSGGMDSRVCLQYAIHQLGKENVIAATVFYGQKHDKELDYAKMIARQLSIPHYIVDLSEVFKFDRNVSALLKGSKKEIEHTSYEQQMKERVDNGEAPISEAYVPFRNGLFLSYVTSMALQLHCDYILYGAHSDDSNVMVESKGGYVCKCQAYPDCTPEFIFHMSRAIGEGTAGKVLLVAPLYDKTKSEVARMGIENGMKKEDFVLTWSCYEGKDGSKECGTCGTCRDKIKALRSIGFTDDELKTMFETTIL